MGAICLYCSAVFAVITMFERRNLLFFAISSKLSAGCHFELNNINIPVSRDMSLGYTPQLISPSYSLLKSLTLRA